MMLVPIHRIERQLEAIAYHLFSANSQRFVHDISGRFVNVIIEENQLFPDHLRD